MHRVLAAHGECASAATSSVTRAYAAPELLATAPNQVWSWDISVPQKAA